MSITEAVRRRTSEIAENPDDLTTAYLVGYHKRDAEVERLRAELKLAQAGPTEGDAIVWRERLWMAERGLRRVTKERHSLLLENRRLRKTRVEFAEEIERLKEASDPNLVEIVRQRNEYRAVRDAARDEVYRLRAEVERLTAQAFVWHGATDPPAGDLNRLLWVEYRESGHCTTESAVTVVLSPGAFVRWGELPKPPVSGEEST